MVYCTYITFTINYNIHLRRTWDSHSHVEHVYYTYHCRLQLHWILEYVHLLGCTRVHVYDSKRLV
jgi:hypothetical protein